MVETITPVVHGGRRRRWGLAVAAHLLGAAIGAAAFGAALGLVGRALGAPWGSAALWVVAAVAALYAARELLDAPVPLPDRKRQVPEWWRTFFGPLASAFLYGLGLGVGFLTYIRHGTLVAVAALAVVLGDPFLGAAVVLPFGVARALTTLLTAPGVHAEAVTALMARLDRWAMSRVPRWLNGGVLVALSVAAGAAATTVAGRTGTWGIAPQALGAVFAWAALSKVVRFRRWRADMETYRLPGEQALAVAVPLAEGAVPLLALTGRPVAAALVALGLLAGFSFAILRARRLAGDRLPCGCFGGTTRRDFRLLLARNGALALLAAAALADRTPPWEGARPAEALPLALVAVALLLGLLLVRESRRLAANRPA
jgi:hypothetical protein